MVAILCAEGCVRGPVPLGHQALCPAQRIRDARLQQIPPLPGRRQEGGIMGCLIVECSRMTDKIDRFVDKKKNNNNITGS